MGSPGRPRSAGPCEGGACALQPASLRRAWEAQAPCSPSLASQASWPPAPSGWGALVRGGERADEPWEAYGRSPSHAGSASAAATTGNSASPSPSDPGLCEPWCSGRYKQKPARAGPCMWSWGGGTAETSYPVVPVTTPGFPGLTQFPNNKPQASAASPHLPGPEGPPTSPGSAPSRLAPECPAAIPTDHPAKGMLETS